MSDQEKWTMPVGTPDSRVYFTEPITKAKIEKVISILNLVKSVWDGGEQAMIGKNEFRFNHDTAVQAFQEWLRKIFLTNPPTVVSVEMVDGVFVVKTNDEPKAPY